MDARARLAALPPHPAQRLVTVYAVLAAVFGLIGVFTVAVGAWMSAPIPVVMTALLAWAVVHLRSNIAAVRLINSAVQNVSRGEIEEAKTLLGLVPPAAAKRNVMRRASALLRAMISLYEGHPNDAEKHASDAIAGRPGMFTHGFESAQIASAQSWRGLARAALGNTAGAGEDARAAEDSPHAPPDVIARGRLVRALVLARNSEYDVLAKHVTANARLVLERALPRERALFRALRKLSRSPKRSVYREPSRPQETEPSKLASWIGSMAPDAAAFVDGEAMFAEKTVDVAPTSEALSDVRALERAEWMNGKRAPQPWKRVLVLWAILIAMFLALWQFLTPAPKPGTVTHVPPPIAEIEEAPSVAGAIAPLGAGLALFGGLLVFVLARTRKLERRLALARRSAAMGETRSVPELALLAKKNNMVIAASAELELARIANDQGDFGEAVARCDNGIGRLQGPMMGAAAGDILLPSLIAESAVGAASRGGREEADAKAALLARDYPTYAWLASAVLRVRLLNAVRSGDMSAALAAARARTAEMPIPLHEDVLADLVLAANVDVSDDEKARLDGELRDDARLRAWIELVAPGLEDRALAAAGRAPVRVVEKDERGRSVPKRAYAHADADAEADAHAHADADADADAEAQAEAEAEAEAEADPGAAARRSST